MNGISVATLWPANQERHRAHRPPPGRAVSSDDLNREIAFAGQRVKQKVIFALTLASVIPRAAQLATATKAADIPTVPSRKDEIGTLMSSFAKMLATIEQQTDEINQFPRRLDQLARQAFRDPLTSLPNRALFMDRLQHALTRTERRGEQLAILFLDLDRF